MSPYLYRFPCCHYFFLNLAYLGIYLRFVITSFIPEPHFSWLVSDSVIENTSCSDDWENGVPLDLSDPRILAMAAAERHFLEADYDEYSESNSSGAAFCRSAALIVSLPFLSYLVESIVSYMLIGCSFRFDHLICNCNSSILMPAFYFCNGS